MTTLAQTTRRSPPKTVVEKLPEEDRTVYESIPATVDYVPHPGYRLKATEEELFGPDAEEVPVAPWRHLPEVEGGEAPAPVASWQLTRRQETVLFMRFNYARYRLATLVTSRKLPRGRSWIRKAVLWHRRAQQNRSALVNANMALVLAMAKRTRIRGLEFSELISEGNMALLRAVEKFDVSRGFKFSTYGCRAILKAFNRLATKTETYRRHFPVEFDPELEKSDEVEHRHVQQHALAVEDLRQVLHHNAAELNETEKAVVQARFAVSGDQRPRTLEQVGQLVGLSKERVRQVQNSALVKLRLAMDDRAA